MTLTEVMTDGTQIVCDVVPMGNDYTICIYGGDLPHVGCVVLSEARPSLTGNGTGVTSSVLCRIGHKDEVIARRIAENVALRYHCTVSCCCGIHIDHITADQLEEVERCTQSILDRIVNQGEICP